MSDQVPDRLGPSLLAGFRTGHQDRVALVFDNHKGMVAWHLRHCFYREGIWIMTHRGICVHLSKAEEFRELVAVLQNHLDATLESEVNLEHD